jgi:hypothetical protein
MQALRIVLATVVMAVLYGVVHDQIAARLSIEYFTVGHQRLFAHDSPTLHGLAGGVIATWWVGLALGAALALCARAGSRPRLDLEHVRPLILGAMCFTALCAAGTGLLAWILASRGAIELPVYWAEVVSLDQQRGFLIDSWMHLASYGAGATAGLVGCAAAWRMRLQPSRGSATPELDRAAPTSDRG